MQHICSKYRGSIFFHKINKAIGSIVDDYTIIAGDFNQVVDGALDKTAYSNNIPKDRMAIRLLMKDLGLMDIWKLVNPREREYTFYSHNHKSRSRIDYFLISKDLVESVADCSIGPIGLTDHAAVQLGLVIEPSGAKKNRWRLNISLFQDPEFSRPVEEELYNIFQVNMGSTDKVGTVWEASKAYVRGKIIAYSSGKKREQTQRVKKLESKLEELEKKKC